MPDHLIFGVPVLEDGVRQLETRWGVRAQPGGHHQGLGTHNALLGLGEGAYLELIAPDPDQPPPPRPRPFGLDALDHPRLVAWAVRADDLDRRVAHTRTQGYDPGDPLELQRTTARGTPLRWRLTPKALAGGPIPFLIDWGDAIHPSIHLGADRADPGVVPPRASTTRGPDQGPGRARGAGCRRSGAYPRVGREDRWPW